MVFGESFLQLPDLFPARSSGEPCGAFDHRLYLPGGPFVLRGLNDRQRAWISRYHHPEPGVDRAPADDDLTDAVTISVFRAAVDDFLDTFVEGHWLELDYGAEEVRVAGFGFMARIEWRPRLSCALWTDGERDELFASGCENFLRVVLAYALLERGGVLLHSAGVVDQSRAFLFAGRSGAGKSTLARLSLQSGREVLSDDLNALLPPSPANPHWRAAKVPFTGELRSELEDGTSASFEGPAAGIYRLAKGDRHRLTPLSAAQAFATLVACCPFVNADPYRLGHLGDVLQRAIAELPVATLTFSLEPGLWQLLRDTQLTSNSDAKPVLPEA